MEKSKKIPCPAIRPHKTEDPTTTTDGRKMIGEGNENESRKATWMWLPRGLVRKLAIPKGEGQSNDAHGNGEKNSAGLNLKVTNITHEQPRQPKFARPGLKGVRLLILRGARRERWLL